MLKDHGTWQTGLSRRQVIAIDKDSHEQHVISISPASLLVAFLTKSCEAADRTPTGGQAWGELIHVLAGHGLRQLPRQSHRSEGGRTDARS